jgi:putative phosphoribosyl transferase
MSVKKRGPKDVIVAVPVAPADAVQALSEDGTKVVCVSTPGPFLAIGEFYEDFGQVEDIEVKRILDENAARRR